MKNYPFTVTAAGRKVTNHEEYILYLEEELEKRTKERNVGLRWIDSMLELANYLRIPDDSNPDYLKNQILKRID